MWHLTKRKGQRTHKCRCVCTCLRFAAIIPLSPCISLPASSWTCASVFKLSKRFVVNPVFLFFTLIWNLGGGREGGVRRLSPLPRPPARP
jgi:hypothetical protein